MIDLSEIDRNKPFVLLETGIPDTSNRSSYLFTGFQEILSFDNGSTGKFFSRVDRFLKNGFWAAGYFTYEFGYHLEPVLAGLKQPAGYPLAWLGVCKEPIMMSSGKSHSGGESFCLRNIKSRISFREYASGIKKIKQHLKEGLTYQVNYTFKTGFDFIGDVFDFYSDLREAQPTAYQSLIYTGEYYIVSLSPELFFRIEKRGSCGRWIVSRPMKGTIRRGRNVREDSFNKEWLRSNEKIAAENVMIVDLLRNDIGRIADTVRVPHLFTVEKYPTLFQMTSTIEGKLKSTAGTGEIFSALFPCGSVTGAPKIETMKIIRRLEKEPRGIYTGAIGFISPDREACFNVAIRTILLKGGRGEIGIGGGVVADSKDRAEYNEALLKAKFLFDRSEAFSVFESLLFDAKTGYFLPDEHLKRLAGSCRCFLIPVSRVKLKSALRKFAVKIQRHFRFKAGSICKVKILVKSDGTVKTEKESLAGVKTPVSIRISRRKTDPGSIWLYHKTTRRKLYDEELAESRKHGCFDVIFFNTNGELTEGAVSNVFVEKNGILYTPPVKCGLLPGVLRGYLLKKRKAREKKLYMKDVLAAERIFIGNSVRGLLEAKILNERRADAKQS